MLKQNTLAEATTELGFATETNTPLTRKITVDGQECIIEGITADKMKEVLNQNGIGTTTFKTPGEIYQDNNLVLNGVVQNYNGTEPTPEPGEFGYDKTKDIFIPGKIEPVGFCRITATKETMEIGSGPFNIFIKNTSDIVIGCIYTDLQPNNTYDIQGEADNISEESLDSMLNEYSDGFVMLTENPVSLAKDITADDILYGHVDVYATGYQLTTGAGDIGFTVFNNSSSYLKLEYETENYTVEPNSSYVFFINFESGLSEQALRDKLDDVVAAISVIQDDYMLESSYTVSNELDVDVYSSQNFNNIKLTMHNTGNRICWLSNKGDKEVSWEYMNQTIYSDEFTDWKTSDISASDIGTEAQFNEYIDVSWE